jgi:phosphatidylglycerol:prolipoprotein diacylglycerol transferase
MLVFPQFDPVAISVGPISIHWYGVMYIIAFGGAWVLANYRRNKIGNHWSSEQISDLVFYGAMGAVLGGRIGSVFFYNIDRFLDDPLWLFRVWEGGMSFHGGFIGVLIAMFLYSKSINRKFWETVDFIAPCVPFGIGAGRLGNFIGGELWGRPTDAPWGMIFSHVDDLPRHPSQLYEIALEGVVLFIVIWWFSSATKPRMAVSGTFAILYGSFRFFIEFFREPDLHIGFIAFDWLTMGQLLSLPMVIVGFSLVIFAYNNKSVTG